MLTTEQNTEENEVFPSSFLLKRRLIILWEVYDILCLFKTHETKLGA